VAPQNRLASSDIEAPLHLTACFGCGDFVCRMRVHHERFHRGQLVRVKNSNALPAITDETL